jgi:hypothetical protein
MAANWKRRFNDPIPLPDGAFRHGGRAFAPIVRACASRLEASAAYLGRERAMRVIGIAVFAVVFLGIVYAAFDLRRDHNQITRIRHTVMRAK